MRIVFMGTPDFAVPSLNALLDAGYDVVGVITQPDRPVGRGHKVAMTPVKQAAVARNVPVYQFERLRKQEGLDCLRALKPDLCVTAAFGQILSRKLLEVPRLGTINVHASLLPKYRGSAPINWCIANGETVTGVTTMLTDIGVDTGDMLMKAETEIGPEETAGELTDRLAQIGAELLIQTLKPYIEGTLKPTPQNEEEMSHVSMLTREDGRLDWTQSAQVLANRVRGFDPWPGTWTALPEGVLKVWKARVCDKPVSGQPGEIAVASAKEGLIVCCGEGALEIIEMQAPNAKRMAAKAYLAGKKLPVGAILGEN